MKKSMAGRLMGCMKRAKELAAQKAKGLRVDRVLITWLAVGIMIGFAGSTLVWMRFYRQRLGQIIGFGGAGGGGQVLQTTEDKVESGEDIADLKITTGSDDAGLSAADQNRRETDQDAPIPVGSIPPEEQPNTADSGTAEEKVEAGMNERLLFPLNGEIRRGFGWYKDESAKEWRFNPGIDIYSARNSDIVAAFSGRVGDIRYDSKYGKIIELEHFGGMSTIYGNVEAEMLSIGEYVAQGRRIGRLGTNWSSESVLHFELRIDGKPLDPVTFAAR